MRDEQNSLHDPRMQQAITELQALIAHHYPSATFEVAVGDDPAGVYLTPMVDVEDTDAVMDIVMDRLLAWQVDEGLPIFVVPLQPLHRVLAQLEAQRQNDAGANIPSM